MSEIVKPANRPAELPVAQAVVFDSDGRRCVHIFDQDNRLSNLPQGTYELYMVPPAPLSGDDQRVKALTEKLAFYAIEEDFDAPGIQKFWCHECGAHIEADGSGHGDGCACYGVKPLSVRASEERDNARLRMDAR